LPRQPASSRAPRPVTLITGASSGIGAALAGVFAEHGHELVLTARRKDHLEDVRTAIAAAGHKEPHIIVADLADQEAPARLVRSLKSRRLEVANLVNNAGFGLYGDAAGLSLAEQLAMIDVNARALTDLCLRFVESLARHKGGILNVASIGGFLPGDRIAVYHATKAYVVSLSEALWRELAQRGIRVSTLCPGPVHTGFHRRAGMPAGIIPGFLFMPVQKVAETGYEGFVAGRRIVIPGFFNKAVVMLERLLPGSMRTGPGTLAGIITRRGG
jgi:short-subunit dehydrogenase